MSNLRKKTQGLIYFFFFCNYEVGKRNYENNDFFSFNGSY